MKTLSVLIVLLTSCYCFSQSGETKYSKEPKSLDFVFSPSLFIQKEVFTDLSIIIGRVETDTRHSKVPPVIGVYGWRLGLESNFKGGNDYIIAPKVGYEMSITFFTIRLSALNYFQNSQSEFRLLPEAGFSIGGMFNLSYGYGISFKNSINGISNHRLSLTINLNKRLSNSVFSSL